MKENALKNVLTDLGLNDYEAVVYVASLSLGPSTILKISRAAEMKRTTVYSVVESLKQRGLMNVEVKGWKSFYVAQNPEKLDSILESRREALKNALPEFAALYNLKGGESTIKYYEGLENVKSIYDQILRDVRPGDDYMILSDSTKWYEQDPKYFQRFREKRAKMNATMKMHIRLLLEDSERAREFKKSENNYFEKVKILPSNVKLKTCMVVIPNRVIIQQLTVPIISVVIENRSIIEMHKEMFEVMWNSIADDAENTIKI